jgi:putative inorganic carbon (HCO3(-)) transporter
MLNPAKTNIITGFFQWLKYNLYTKRFNSVPGLILMGLVGAGIGLGSVMIDPRFPLLVAFGAAGILFVIACFRYPVVGFYVSLIASAFLSMPDRILRSPIPVPLGVVIEAIQYLALLSIIAKQYRERTPTGPFWRNPLTLMFLVLLAYYTCDIFNPVYHSSLGWFNFLRKQFSYLAFYYMAYILMDSYEAIMRFLKIWLVLSLLIALWGIRQQWFGLADFEMVWLRSNPEAYALAYQSGFLRKFSVLSDPATFGVLVAAMMVFTMVMAARTTSKEDATSSCWPRSLFFWHPAIPAPAPATL